MKYTIPRIRELATDPRECICTSGSAASGSASGLIHCDLGAAAEDQDSYCTGGSGGESSVNCFNGNSNTDNMPSICGTGTFVWPGSSCSDGGSPS